MPVRSSDLLRRKTITLLFGPENPLRAAFAGALREQGGEGLYAFRDAPRLLSALEPEQGEHVRVAWCGTGGRCRGNAAVPLLAVGMDDILWRMPVDRVLSTEEQRVLL